ncbi:MAG: ion transporter [Candidatus Electrothrix sp. AUS3]|nr:ion transporter [Candidatus Electrothrix gigas]
MDKLREIILESDTKKGRTFDIAIQLLIAISLIAISLETLPELERKTYLFLATLEKVIAVIFTIEYLLRIFLTEKKTSYLFSFYGIIDLLAILPFYLSGGVSFQTLRMLRFIRLFRILKLTRYTDAISRIGKAICIAKEELVLFSVVTLMLLYLSAVGIYHFEHAAQPENYKSLFDCLWWAMATLTTVGYGDIYPITIGGRLFTFVILMLGLGVVAVPTGVIASALSAVRKSDNKT